jgi:hypothetical protein
VEVPLTKCETRKNPLRHRLRPPVGLEAAVAELGGWLGPRLAVRDGDWQLKMAGWKAKERP